jgi:hypothetical protein
MKIEKFSIKIKDFEFLVFYKLINGQMEFYDIQTLDGNHLWYGKNSDNIFLDFGNYQFFMIPYIIDCNATEIVPKMGNMLV